VLGVVCLNSIAECIFAGALSGLHVIFAARAFVFVFKQAGFNNVVAHQGDAVLIRKFAKVRADFIGRFCRSLCFSRLPSE
jgi:hypothetical protein